MTTDRAGHPLAGHGAMFLFSALVAGSFSLGGQIANDIEPLPLNAVRFSVAASAMLAIAMATGNMRHSYCVAPWRYVVLSSCMITYFALMFEALKTTTPVSTAAVFTLTPIISAIFGWMLLRQITTTRIGFALFIGANGALWVIFRADIAAVLSFDIGWGEKIFLFGCAAHALYTPLVKKLHRGEPALAFTALMLVAGAVLLLAYSAPYLITFPWGEMNGFFWIALAYLSLVTTGFTFFLVQFAALRLPASKVMAYTYLTPAWVVLWDRLIGVPFPTSWIVVGIVICLTALFLLLKD